MAKGIRKAVLATFIANIQLRNAGELGDITSGTLSKGNVAFRKSVIDFTMTTFNVKAGSAATHYNWAFKSVKGTDPELVAGLGRADDKKGGRKVGTKNAAAAIVVQLFNVVKVKDGSVQAEGLTAEAAQAMLDANAASKKAKLQMVEAPVPEVVETIAEETAEEVVTETSEVVQEVAVEEVEQTPETV